MSQSRGGLQVLLFEEGPLTKSVKPQSPRDGDVGVLASITTSTIRRDGGTQCRSSISPRLVATYSELMTDGVTFPPIRVWFDGQDYWLSDGFHRLAAAEKNKATHIRALIFSGTVIEARWDSYGANSTHGQQLSPREQNRALRSALAHPTAATQSNVEISRFLGLSESTVRRWRTRVMGVTPESEQFRWVSRNGRTYKMAIRGIGRNDHCLVVKGKSKVALKSGLETMKHLASPEVRPVINIFVNWMIGSASVDACVTALERFVSSRRSTRR